MPQIIKLCIIGTLALGMMACSDNKLSQHNNERADIGPPTDATLGSDTSTDVDTESGEDASPVLDNYKVTFELVNNSGLPIFAYRTVTSVSPCHNEPDDWLTISRQSGGYMSISRDCALCECDETSCAVCDVMCLESPTALTAKLEQGEMRQFEWDGRAWKSKIDTGQRCQFPELLGGETLKATFCYGSNFEEDPRAQSPGAGFIVHPACETLEFTLNQAEQTVRLVVPPQLTIRMINDSGRDLYASPDAVSSTDAVPSCYDSWFKLGDGTSLYNLSPPCDQCECAYLASSNPNHTICDSRCSLVDCQPPQIAHQLWPAGEARVATWNRTIATESEVLEQTCNTQIVAPAGTHIARFCWSESIHPTSDEGGMLGEVICEEVVFEHDDEVVELRVQ